MFYDLNCIACVMTTPSNYTIQWLDGVRFNRPAILFSYTNTIYMHRTHFYTWYINIYSYKWMWVRRTACDSVHIYVNRGMVKCMGGCWVFPAACERSCKGFRKRRILLTSRREHKSITCAYLWCLPPSLTIYISLAQYFKIDMLIVLNNKINRYPSEQRIRIIIKIFYGRDHHIYIFHKFLQDICAYDDGQWCWWWNELAFFTLCVKFIWRRV